MSKNKPSKNSTTEQKLSPIEEKLLNEIRYLGKSISIVDDYYLKLKHIPTRKGEFPELIVMDPTSGAIPREPLKQVQEKYPEWYEAWRQVVQPAGKFYKIYNRLKDELRPILKTNYEAFYNLEDLYWWHINEDNNSLLDKIQKIRNAIIELREKKKKKKEVETTKTEKATHFRSQELQSIESTLIYNKTTGKFRYEDTESIPISKTPRHKVRNMAEKLMKWWKKGKPCPQSEIVRNPKKKTPASIYDNTTTIRNALKDIKVNMPQCAEDEYSLPSEPKSFNIVSNN